MGLEQRKPTVDVTQDTIEMQLGPDTVEMRTDAVKKSILQRIADTFRHLNRVRREYQMPSGLTLDQNDALIAEHNRRLNAIYEEGYQGFPYDLMPRDVRLQMLMNLLAEKHPELASDPKIRVHVAEEAGYVPSIG